MDIAATVPSWFELCVALNVASAQGWGVSCRDISTAFLHSDIIEEGGVPIVVIPPKFLVRLGLVEEGELWRLRKGMYGLRSSPKAWELCRNEVLGKLQGQMGD
eukprot:1019205-Amphidinium_carterae.1